MNLYDFAQRATEMTVGVFWSRLQDLESKLRADQAVLDSDRLRLQRAYSAARNDPDAERSARRRAALAPAIHRNSKDRLDHREVLAKYNKAAAAARDDLAKIGVRVPTLSGLGVAPVVIVGVVAVTLLGAAFAAWAINHDNILSHQSDTDALIAQDRAAASIVTSPNATADQKSQALAIMKSGQKTLDKAVSTPKPADPFGIANALQALVPVLGLVAIIAIAPKLITPSKATA